MDNVCGYKIKVIESDYNDFLTELGKADLILTPTRRLATRLNQDYAKLQIAQQNVWQINIISLTGWLEQLWQEQQVVLKNPQITRLNAWQNLIIWQSLTDNNEQLAQLAIQAWTTLKEWNIDWNTIDKTYASSDVKTFLNWCEQFQTHCQQENYCDPASITQLLNPDAKNINKIYLIGFTDIKPAILNIFKKFNHTQIEILEFRVANAIIHCAPKADNHAELQAAALWAKKHLDKNPVAPIAVIIPDLSQRFKEVDNIFSRTILPQTLLANHYHDHKPYNISSGNKLADFPIIAIAFDFLLNKKISGSIFINPDSVIDNYANIFLLPSSWVEIIKQALTACNWPGQRILNSLEYQVVTRFYEMLTEYCSLDYVQKPISFSQAVNQIVQQAHRMIFQGESENAPLQILGALEGEGLYFQNLWLMGLDQENWPPKAKPHPFLPIDLQRQHHMPHASSEREYMFTQHLTKRYCEQAHQVILSYPQMSEDRNLMPSHLIRQYPLMATEILYSECELFKLKLQLESWLDEVFPLIHNEIISGGVGLLQAQSVCPFQAFAKYRLKVKPLEPLQNGLSLLLRGELTHDALDYFWRQVKNSKKLRELNNDELNQKINDSIQYALQKIVDQKLSKNQFNLEKNRLHQLLSQWIVLEKDRPDFEVLHTEKAIDVDLSQLKLRARIDRIDKLATGEIVLIDYKTGQIEQIDVLDKRPKQVQLPLYAISYPDASTVAYAKINATDYQFKYIDPLELTWDEIKQHWRNTLNQLADEFYSGVVDVNPLEAEQTCRYCGLESLCRIRSR